MSADARSARAARRHGRRFGRREGWPDGLPFDDVRAGLADLATEYRTVVARADAVRAPFGRSHPFRRIHLLAIAGVIGVISLHSLLRLVLAHRDQVFATVVAAIVLGMLSAIWGTWWAAVQRLPRRRVFLRAVGVPVCIGCGQAIATNDPRATCPECGRAHEDLPVGFGFEIEPGLARDRDDACTAARAGRPAEDRA